MGLPLLSAWRVEVHRNGSDAFSHPFDYLPNFWYIGARAYGYIRDVTM